MSEYSITAANATSISINLDQIIFDEITAIKRMVLTRSTAGFKDATVSNSTIMTQSSPVITITGTILEPTVTDLATVILGDTTVVLGATGTSLNAVIADINDQTGDNIHASKNSTDQLIITYTPDNGVWQLVIGAGSANGDLGLTQATILSPTPASVDYFNVWRGDAQDRQLHGHMTKIIRSIESKGFNIVRRTNPVTGITFSWFIQW